MKKIGILRKITAMILCTAFLTACGSDSGKDESKLDVFNEVSSESSSDSSEVGADDLSADESTDLSKDESMDSSKDETETQEYKGAIYKGVSGYGTETAENKSKFKYIFSIDGEEKTFTMDNGIKGPDGRYTYDIQNTLIRDFEYDITVKNGKVTSAVLKTDLVMKAPTVSGVAGEKTIANLIKTAMMPVGTTLYVYGGGWDWQDVGSSNQAETIGISGYWQYFFRQNKGDYVFNSPDKANSYYPYGKWNEYYYAGLDCSGYIGWAVYNVAYDKSGNEGFVMSASKMAKSFADKGWGTLSQNIGETPEASKGMLKPGDIVSKSGHVWMCVGACDDGSVVILHSTPSESRTGKKGGGVQLSALGNDENCKAYALADKYMKDYFPEWYEDYPAIYKDFKDYTTFSGDLGIFSWDVSENSFMNDDEGIRSMSAEQVLEYIFKDAK